VRRSFLAPAALALRNLSLKTKLLLTMLSLLVLSVSALFLLHLYSEQRLLAHVRDYTDELSTAIDIAQQQPAAESDPKATLTALIEAYAENLRKLGVKDLSVTDAADEVQASTNPDIVGKRLVRSRKKGQEFVIKGVLGDESGPPGTQKTSTLTVPIVVGDRRVGALLITRILDDFSALSKNAFLERLFATLAVFAFGILVALYLSWTFTRPLHGLTEAARQVAAGNLSVKVPSGGTDEIASLSRTFNEMVERLRENRQLEERLHFAERSTAMGRLASAMAHEIRNPLNFFNLSIDHLRQQLGAAGTGRREEFDHILGNMKDEISRLNRLVVDFLSFGKPMRLDPRPCAIERVLREVASLVDHKARDQGIALTVTAEDDLPLVVADPELLKTCFLNLMINAVDAMPEGGLLSVSVRRTRDERGELLQMEVSDTGRGMSAEDIRTAFEPYFSTKETGVGLGLSLTRKIVEDHGGTIEIESAPGQGTTARIVLPLVAPRAPLEAREAVAS
jgi:signal transduction histidine kinase